MDFFDLLASPKCSHLPVIDANRLDFLNILVDSYPTDLEVLAVTIISFS
jgi:hypothetical protein